MTTQEKQALDKLEEQMRSSAVGIANIAAAMCALEKNAAKDALTGIVDYLKEKIEQVEYC